MKKLLAGLLLIVALLTGCEVDNSKKEPLIHYPEAKNQDSVILLDRFSKKMFSYNTKTFSIEEKCNVDNFVQYEFPTESDYYTSGHSIENDFEIIKIENNKINHLLKLGSDEAIFPIATIGETLLFKKSIYDGIECVDNILVSYDKKSNVLIEYPNTRLSICSGTIINDKLFFTAYTKEDTYNLYSIKYNDHQAIPVLEKSGLSSKDIYSQENNLYLSDDTYIYNATTGKKFSKASENYFFGSRYLLQYKISPSADLTMVIIDTQTNKEVFSTKNILGFKVTEHQIVTYFDGKVETFDY